MINKERITDRYHDNAKEFDQIVIDTFKIIEEKDKAVWILAQQLIKVANDLDNTPHGLPKIASECRELASEYLKGE